MAVLHSTDRSRSRLQEPQGRLELATHFPPEGGADRRPHLRGFLVLLSTGDLAWAFTALGSRTHFQGRARQICGDANGRCPFSDYRWAGAYLPALHPTGERPENDPGAT